MKQVTRGKSYSSVLELNETSVAEVVSAETWPVSVHVGAIDAAPGITRYAADVP